MAEKETVKAKDTTVEPLVAIEEMVSVSRADLDAILARLSSVEETNKDLLKSAPNDQLARIEAMRRSGKLVKSIKIRNVDGKNVVGWKMTKDDVYFEGTKLVENQIVGVVFDDKTSKEINLRDFNRLAIYNKFEVIREAKDSDGAIYLTVMGTDGKEITINQIYVN